MKNLTIRQAAGECRMPESRIRRAIKRGFLPSEMKKGKYLIDPQDFDKFRKRKTILCWRENRRIAVRIIKDFLIVDSTVESFATERAADQYESMLNAA